MTNEEIQAQLRAVMETDGFTQTDVAKITGLSQSVISRLLQGKVKNPPQDTVNRIRAFLGQKKGLDVLSHEDVRKAVRLYRYVRNAVEKGSKIIVVNPDGSENHVIFLW